MTLNHSEHIDQIATALSVLQSKLATVDKAAANPFFKSKYTPLEDIVDSFRPHLAALGLAFTQSAAWIDGRTVMITRVLHATGQWIESAFPLEPVPDKSGFVTPQGWGSASTYARRYGLQAALGITTRRRRRRRQPGQRQRSGFVGKTDAFQRHTRHRAQQRLGDPVGPRGRQGPAQAGGAAADSGVRGGR